MKTIFLCCLVVVFKYIPYYNSLSDMYQYYPFCGLLIHCDKVHHDTEVFNFDKFQYLYFFGVEHAFGAISKNAQQNSV